jgi:hypothetical protein
LGVAVSGDYAYVADHEPGLLVLNISNPANPYPVGGYNTRGSAGDVAVLGNYAYVARTGGLDVIDIRNPTKPRWVGAYDTTGSGLGVAVSGNYAYVMDYLAGLQVIDIRNPVNPQRVGGNSAFVAFRVAVAGDKVFVAAVEDGLVILDLFRPVRLEPLPSVSQGTFRLQVDGPRAVTVQLQRSSNLIDWQAWQPVTFGAAAIEVSDAEAATSPHRFYRFVLP